MQIKATCGACGSEMLEVPEAGEADQMIRCASCKADIGDKASVDEALKKRAKEEADKIMAEFKKTLSKSGFK